MKAKCSCVKCGSQLGWPFFQKVEQCILTRHKKQRIILAVLHMKEQTNSLSDMLDLTQSVGRARLFQHHTSPLTTNLSISEEKIQKNLPPRNPISISDSFISLLMILSKHPPLFKRAKEKINLQSSCCYPLR